MSIRSIIRWIRGYRNLLQGDVATVTTLAPFDKTPTHVGSSHSGLPFNGMTGHNRLHYDPKEADRQMKDLMLTPLDGAVIQIEFRGTRSGHAYITGDPAIDEVLRNRVPLMMIVSMPKCITRHEVSGDIVEYTLANSLVTLRCTDGTWQFDTARFTLRTDHRSAIKNAATTRRRPV